VKRCIAAACLLLIALTSPASAHQLDEYVQASKLSVGKDQVRVELRLTPGVKVLPSVLAGIDANGDGRLSSVEQRAYAERVQRDLSLVLDGKRLPLRLVAVRFPDVGDMKEGLGEIQLELVADVPAGSAARTLTFENHHRSDVAVYLANALVPPDADIRIAAQRRSYDQASFTLDYTQSGALGLSAAPRQSGTATASEVKGYVGMVRLGMRHIAEGTDHLLFLLVLLLPAPLVAFAGRWTSDAGVRPQDSGVRPRDFLVRPTDSGVRPLDSGVRPPDSGVRPRGKKILGIVTA